MVQNGKNEPFLKEHYKAVSGKEAVTKEGKQSKLYLDWKLKEFKPMKPTVLKNFGVCVPDIDAGKTTANECYDSAYHKAIENGSVYISPALRRKTKEAEFQAKYDIAALEKKFKEKYGIK